MNSDGGPANRENETARIEAFSDGVFAIAITLLVIEIGVPHLDNGPEGTTLFGALIGQWPSYLGYVISFLQIGVVCSRAWRAVAAASSKTSTYTHSGPLGHKASCSSRRRR
jgi:uncharacterized membrane protein